MNDKTTTSNKVVLITGAAQRIGAETARLLHHAGMNIVLHYRHSSQQALALSKELNQLRNHSALPLQADLLDITNIDTLINHAHEEWQRLDAVVNNASSFYPTPIGSATEAHWDDLMGSNLKAPFFLAQAAAPYLKKQQGCIINIVDIHGQRPMKNHSIYCIAKAGLQMLTMSLARELGPDIRVNGVAPGAILWPEEELALEAQQQIIERTALKRQGSPTDIARTVRFLIEEAAYISGQVINVDGGRSLSQ